MKAQYEKPSLPSAADIAGIVQEEVAYLCKEHVLLYYSGLSRVLVLAKVFFPTTEQQ